MNIPHIIVTDGDGNPIPLDELPDAVREAVLSKAAERVRRSDALQEPSAMDIFPLVAKLEAYSSDPRPREDRGPSPLNEELASIIKRLVILRSVHRQIILRISSDGDPLTTQEEKLCFASWIRDEANIKAAIDVLTEALE
jgi:hypothetical protein